MITFGAPAALSTRGRLGEVIDHLPSRYIARDSHILELDLLAVLL